MREQRGEENVTSLFARGSEFEGMFTGNWGDTVQREMAAPEGRARLWGGHRAGTGWSLLRKLGTVFQ